MIFTDWLIHWLMLDCGEDYKETFKVLNSITLALAFFFLGKGTHFAIFWGMQCVTFAKRLATV